MNILLWILQIILAFYYLAGGIYMVNHYKLLASMWALNMLPQPAWIVLGVLQVLFALGLVLPGVKLIPHKVTTISAVCLAIISLLGSILYVSYTGTGLLWALIPAILLAFVAYKRRGWH